MRPHDSICVWSGVSGPEKSFGLGPSLGEVHGAEIEAIQGWIGSRDRGRESACSNQNFQNSMLFYRKIAEARANLTHPTRGLARTIEPRKSVCKVRLDRGDCRCKSTCPDQNFRNLMQFCREIAEVRAHPTHPTRVLARTIEPRKSGCKDRSDRGDRGCESICSD